MANINKKKLLLIKLGYSETLDNTLSLQTSLGDVLRTTFILHYFKSYEIYWLTDKKTKPLLENNKYIKRIIFNSPSNLIDLRKQRFATVINLEKSRGIYSFVSQLNVKERLGFWADGFRSPRHSSYKGGRKLFKISQDIKHRKKNRLFWQDVIAQALGKHWGGEKYILGYNPKSRVKYDIGFNWTTSKKWKNKVWPKKHWRKLERLIKNDYKISWQQGFNNLYKYIDWVNSCRLIITADTLGLHLGLALRKKVIALFGPTSPHEIFLYNCGSYLVPKSQYNCIPCYMFDCDKKNCCMEYILPEKVKERIDNEFFKYTPKI